MPYTTTYHYWGPNEARFVSMGVLPIARVVNPSCTMEYDDHPDGTCIAVLTAMNTPQAGYFDICRDCDNDDCCIVVQYQEQFCSLMQVLCDDVNTPNKEKRFDMRPKFV